MCVRLSVCTHIAKNPAINNDASSSYFAQKLGRKSGDGPPLASEGRKCQKGKFLDNDNGHRRGRPGSRPYLHIRLKIELECAGGPSQTL